MFEPSLKSSIFSSCLLPLDLFFAEPNFYTLGFLTLLSCMGLTFRETDYLLELLFTLCFCTRFLGLKLKCDASPLLLVN